MTDIAKLFAQDPLTYTKDGGELAAIIKYYRENRRVFTQQQALGKKAAVEPGSVKLDLGDLGI